MFSLPERLSNRFYCEEISTFSAAYEESFTFKNILITGASGLIGLPLVDILMKCKDVNVFALCRNQSYAAEVFKPYINNNSFHLLVGSVDTFDFSKYNFDYIIHAASDADPKSIAAHPVGVMKANIGGVVNLLEYGKSHKCRIIYISSGEVYGEDVLKTGKFTEDNCGYIDTKKTRSSYPESKRAAETFCVSYKEEYGVDVLVVRLCHAYGPTMKLTDTRVLAEFIMDAVKGQAIVMKSEGMQKRSLCYVFDAVSAFLFLLMQGKTGEFYNITGGDGSVKRIREMAEIIGKAGNVETQIKPVPLDYDTKYASFDHAHLDSNKLKSLGWEAKCDFETGIAHTIRIMKE